MANQAKTQTSDRFIPTRTLVFALISLIGSGLLIQNLDFLYPLFHQPEPLPQAVVELPPFLEGCRSDEVNRMTVTQCEDRLYLDLQYHCSDMEMTREQQLLKAQGLSEDTRSYLEFGITVEQFDDGQKLETALIQELMRWAQFYQRAGCFYSCVRINETEITEANMLDFVEVLDAQSWQADQLLRVEDRIVGTVGMRMFSFSRINRTKINADPTQSIPWDLTDPKVIAKIRPLIDTEVPPSLQFNAE